MFKHSVEKLFIFICLFIIFAAWVYRTSVFRISQNFYEVEVGQLYRSAQLSQQEMKEFIGKYQIKTVISLRGYPPREVMGNSINEMENLKNLNVQFVPIDLDDNYYPSQANALKIIEALEKSTYPILIHCRVGSDRTGMVAGMYKKFIKNKTDEEALDQLQFKYWHVRALRPAMSNFIKKVPTLDWLKKNYNECLPEFADLRNPDYVCK